MITSKNNLTLIVHVALQHPLKKEECKQRKTRSRKTFDQN